MSSARVSPSERVYAALLLAYPRRYRRRFGADQRELFHDLHRRARDGGGAPAVCRFWLRQLGDLARTAPLERLAALREMLVHGLVPDPVRPVAPPGDGMFRSFMQDLALAARMLRKSPLFTVVAVVVIAIGAGAVTTIYSAANALLLRPIPGVRDPGRVVVVTRTGVDGRRQSNVSYPFYRHLADGTHALSGLAAWTMLPLTIGVDDARMNGAGNLVSANYFDVLGVRPLLGRFFTPAEDSAAGAHPVVVIGYGFWQRAMGADPHVLGRVISLNGTPLTVIGVAPADFAGTVPVVPPDAWVPMSMQPQVRPGERLLTTPNAGWLEMFGRLAPAVSRDAAEAELRTLTKGLAGQFGETAAFRTMSGARIYTLSMIPPDARGPVFGFVGVLLAISGLVLLIASVNVAGMVLARGIGRRRELAVRAALGAGRRRLVAQLLTESVLLFGMGAVAGVALAFWGTRLLEHIRMPADIPVVLHLAPDGRVLAGSLAVAVATGLAFGLAPALRATRTDLAATLRGDTAGGGHRRSRARALVVAGQMALSLLLLVSAGLFMRALTRGQRVDPGIDVHGVATAALNVRIAGYDSADGARIFDLLKQRVAAAPGVTRVAYARLLPLSMNSMAEGVAVDGYRPQSGERTDRQITGFDIVDPEYFATVRMPIVRGRDFQPSDDARAPRVAIVNETFARHYWNGAEALGRTFHVDSVPYTVVGVARDAKYDRLNEEPQPFMYLPMAQHWDPDRVLLARTTGDPDALDAPIRQAVRALAPNMPAPPVSSLRAVTSVALLPQRVAAGVTGSLGVLGLLLAAVGLYGILAYSMSQRTREIGIRMALGADRASVVRLVLGEGMRLVGVGIGVGLALAVAATWVMRPFLFGVSPVDPLTIGGMTLGLLAIALLASYVPARRAASADPADVLRDE